MKTILKRSLKRVSRHIWFRKRLPDRAGGGRILVSPSSYLRYWTYSLDSIHGELITAIQRLTKPGQCVWDIGANVGVATFTAAHLVGRDGFVLSIDADARLVERLRETSAARAHGGATVEILPVAVSDRLGVVKFNLSRHSTATNSIDGFGYFGEAIRSVSMPCVTLDWLLSQFRHPELIKIDVEGAEALVLRGAKDLLHEVRPIIILEVGDRSRPEVSTILSAVDYKTLRMNDFAATDHVEGDIVAIPAEKIAEQMVGFTST